MELKNYENIYQRLTDLKVYVKILINYTVSWVCILFNLIEELQLSIQ